MKTVSCHTVARSDEDWKLFSEWITSVLKENIVTVTFTKKDGSERVMRCTLNPELLPKVEIKENKVERKRSDTSIAVYDLEAAGWRSFITRSVKKIEFSL
jgi:WYL_2, Sm-like SH3 beta-barrel fold